MMRKTILLPVIVWLAMGLTAWGATKDSKFPTKPITVVVGYEAGSSSDQMAREIFKNTEKLLGKPSIIINKPGASSAIMLGELRRARPDGYTIGYSSSVHVLKVQGLFEYDHKDFDTLGILSVSWSALCVPADSKFKKVEDLVAEAKAKPGQLKFSTTSRGAAQWIVAKCFERAIGAKFNVLENPGGAAMVATQLAGGHVDCGFAGYKAVQSQVDGGKVRVLAMTAGQRAQGYPNIPTLKERGVDLEMLTWSVFVAPKGLPRDVKDRLLKYLRDVGTTPEWAKWCASKGSIPTPDYLGDKCVEVMDKEAQLQAPVLLEIKGSK